MLITAPSTVSQPHDKLVKRLLSNPETAVDILNLYLPPEVRTLVDLTNLSLQRDSFIDDEHRAFAVDLLYKTTFAGEEGYLWILLEHQRNPDPWLPMRIFKYMATIWDHLRKISKTGKVPLIYPIIIYNGDRPYPHTLTLQDMIAPEASQKLFSSFFKTPFCIIDLSTIQDETLKNQYQDNVRGIALLVTLKHVNNKNLQMIFEQFLVDIYQQLDHENSKDDLADLLSYLLKESEGLQEDRFWDIIKQKFSSEVEEKTMTIAQKIEARGFEKGIERGIEKGREESREIIATHMLSAGYDFNTISKLTGLAAEKLLALKKSSH